MGVPDEESGQMIAVTVVTFDGRTYVIPVSQYDKFMSLIFAMEDHDYLDGPDDYEEFIETYERYEVDGDVWPRLYADEGYEQGSDWRE